MSRSLRPVAAALVLVLVSVLATAAVLDRRSTGDAAPRAVAPQEGQPALGVFRGTDADEVADFAQWLGRPLDLVVDYSARDTWEQIARPTYMLEEWQGTGLRPVYGVAMLPREDDSATLARGAAGEYDEHFRTLAGELVAHDQADAVLRLGWEFNLEGSRWSTDDPELFIAYWRRIVQVMRDVEGQALEFDWNPNNGEGNRYDAPEYYPGSDVVDYVGVDVYDQASKDGTYPYPASCDSECRQTRQQRAWEEQIHGGDRGLRFWRDFAAGKGKPLSLPEWGLWSRPDGTGGGDNRFFLERMHEFIEDPANGVAYSAYFEYDGSNGRHSLRDSFPAAGALYRFLVTR